MRLNIRYPNITGTTEREQLMQMKNYLWQLVENLNYEFGDIGKKETKETKQTVDPPPGKQTTVSEFLKAAMPVGHIYISLAETNPNVLFGFGTWERIEDHFLLAAGKTYSAGSTGGAATHTLTVDEMPSHYHTPYTYNDAGSESGYKRQFTTNLHTGSSSVARTQIATGTSGRYAMTGTTSSDIAETAYTSAVGGGKEHNNMPPYTTVYVWKRTA